MNSLIIQKITTKHQYTPNMLLLLLPSFFSFMLHIVTYTRLTLLQRQNRTGQWSVLQFDSVQVTGVKSEKDLSLVCHRKKRFFHSLPSYIYGSSRFKSKSSSTADALLSPEVGGGCRTRRTNLTVLYMVVEEGEDVCYMTVR